MVNTLLHNCLVDVKSKNLWRAALAELIGTAYLVFLGCASCLGSTWGHAPSNVQISLTFGVAVATVVYGIAHVSGGHVNPAVSCALLITRRITLVRCVVYIIFQCIGAVLGAGLVKIITPAKYIESLGITSLNPILKNAFSGLLVEALITLLLVFTVFACCDSNRQPTGSVPLTIGLSVALCHFVAIKYTGSSMNPARTFGPALVGGLWSAHWVYWIGPILGGIVAGLLYDFVFAENACPAKIKNFFSDAEYNGDLRYDGASLEHERRKANEESKKMIENL